MPGRISKTLCVASLLSLILLGRAGISRADEPATQPAIVLQAGDMLLSFPERSPMSSKKELARRLSVTAAALEEPDYDITKCRFKAYIPQGFDSGDAVGIFVYLGYKDSVSTPPMFKPAMDKAHMIFITPECHSGDQYLPSVPMWQTTGLALDAVYNLQKLCKIDPNRVYQMSWNNGMQTALVTCDVFKGFALVGTRGWYSNVSAGGNAYFAGTFPIPPGTLISLAHRRAFLFMENTDRLADKYVQARMTSMKNAGFTHVEEITVDTLAQLHYPNLTTDWFEGQALPFLDAASAAEAKSGNRINTPATSVSPVAESPTPTTPIPAQAPPAAAAAVAAALKSSEAQRLLGVAKLYIANNQSELAKPKLQQIIDDYPTDPAAVEAKQLLDKINSQ